MSDRAGVGAGTVVATTNATVVAATTAAAAAAVAEGGATPSSALVTDDTEPDSLNGQVSSKAMRQLVQRLERAVRWMGVNTCVTLKVVVRIPPRVKLLMPCIEGVTTVADLLDAIEHGIPGIGLAGLSLTTDGAVLAPETLLSAVAHDMQELTAKCYSVPTINTSIRTGPPGSMASVMKRIPNRRRPRASLQSAPPRRPSSLVKEASRGSMPIPAAGPSPRPHASPPRGEALSFAELLGGPTPLGSVPHDSKPPLLLSAHQDPAAVSTGYRRAHVVTVSAHSPVQSVLPSSDDKARVRPENSPQVVLRSPHGMTPSPPQAGVSSSPQQPEVLHGQLRGALTAHGAARGKPDMVVKVANSNTAPHVRLSSPRAAQPVDGALPPSAASGMSVGVNDSRAFTAAWWSGLGSPTSSPTRPAGSSPLATGAVPAPRLSPSRQYRGPPIDPATDYPSNLGNSVATSASIVPSAPASWSANVQVTPSRSAAATIPTTVKAASELFKATFGNGRPPSDDAELEVSGAHPATPPDPRPALARRPKPAVGPSAPTNGKAGVTSTATEAIVAAAMHAVLQDVDRIAARGRTTGRR